MIKRSIGTIVISLTFLYSSGQDKGYIDAPYIGLPSRQTETIEVDSLKQLPPRIPFIIDQLFKTSMTDFINNIVFIKGQIIDIEAWAAKDSTFQTEYEFIIPKYELFFELRDTTISIKRYCFELSMDQYGQITRFDWPREGFNKRADFATGMALKKEAIKYATKKHYKTKECLYELVFDESKKRLVWQFSFLQRSSGNEANSLKEYRTIVLDALSKAFIEELESQTVSIAD